MQRFPDRIRSFASFDRIPVPITTSEIDEELRNWPVDALLGLMGRFSRDALTLGPAFYDDRYQNRIKEAAVVDCFPVELVEAEKRKFLLDSVGSPAAHPQNLAWLSHRAILNCIRGNRTEAFDRKMTTRFSRLLVLGNTALSVGFSDKAPTNLLEGKHTSLKVLRQWQFSQSFDAKDVIRQMARQYRIFTEYLPRFYDVAEAFQRVTNGIALKVFFAVAYEVLFDVLKEQMSGPNDRSGQGLPSPWIDKHRHLTELEQYRDQAERILGWWTATPEEYEAANLQWRTEHKEADSRFDFVQLRSTPLIEARPGELVCPVSHFLLRKAVDDLYYILVQGLGDSERQKFQQKLGDAYEAYSNDLLEAVATKDIRGKWQFWPNPKLKGGTEVADALLSRGETVIVFEHKALRPSLDFLLGGNGDRVLGPPDDFIDQLENGRLSVGDLQGLDKGLFTRVLNQQSRAIGRVLRFMQSQGETDPNRVFACITHLTDMQIGPVVNGHYMAPLITAAGYYSDPAWKYPQWLHVQDVELIEAMADEATLDLESLLETKLTNAPHEAFDVYLAWFINARGRRPKEIRTKAWIDAFIEEVGRLLFPTSQASEL